MKDQKEKTIISVMNLIRQYADIVCEDNNVFKEDIISDCVVESVKIVNGDINNKLTPKDIFNGWIKDIFDEALTSYKKQREMEIPFSEINENDRNITRKNAIDDIDIIYALILF